MLNLREQMVLPEDCSRGAGPVMVTDNGLDQLESVPLSSVGLSAYTECLCRSRSNSPDMGRAR